MTTQIFSRTRQSHRQYLARLGVMLLLATLISACGFALRGAVNLPFNSICITLPESAPLAIELKRNILANGQTRITRSEKDAAVILEILNENKDKQILSLNSQGRVREYNLTYTLRFRVRDHVGKEFLEATEVSLKRNLSFNESQVLAKESEEALLYRDMQTELVQQIMRRLAVLKVE